MTAEERRWRREERAELQQALDEANRHRPDCLCRAVTDWSPGPACYQNLRS